MEKTDFYTQKGYERINSPDLTPAMEDYLEMICRIGGKEHPVRIRDLAKNLHVRPSSTTKMVQHLDRIGLLSAKRYGDITLTEKGKATGNYLLYRHAVIHRFLCALNHSDDELAEVEKIEHFLSRITVGNLAALVGITPPKDAI